jgi:hypothetical protein
MGVKDKPFPGGKVPGFAAEGNDSFPSNDFPLNQSLTKKYGNAKRKLKLKTEIDRKGEVYEREGT